MDLEKNYVKYYNVTAYIQKDRYWMQQAIRIVMQ